MSLTLFPACSYGDSEYREISTSAGKVLIGPGKEEALEKFGVPAQADEDLWFYSAPEKFFIFFPRRSLLNVYLYPQHSNIAVGIPLELKAFGCFSDSTIKDITKEVQLLISEPKDFISDTPGVVIPKKTGEYQILVKYKDVFSNPAYLLVKETPLKQSDKEKLININVLPYKPIIPHEGELQFFALGTFINPSGLYSVRDITKQVSWYVRQGNQEIENRGKGNLIYFAFSPQSRTVFCRYRGSQSFPQEVLTQDNPGITSQTLKHITLLPEFISVLSGKDISLRAFGTYYSNKVEDITGKVNWEISDKDVVASQGKGEFLAKSVGVAAVTAESGDFSSLATKIIVTDVEPKDTLFVEEKRKKIDLESLSEDIIKEVQKLKQNLSQEEKKLSVIKIIPDTLEVASGETKQVAASGIYSDKSREDLTYLGDWSSLNNKIAKVSSGKVEAILAGETKIYITFKGIKSLPASVKVLGPKLVSIILSPQDIQMSMNDKISLKAEGNFSDSSRKDITALVDWKIADPRIIKIDKGQITPLRFGRTEVLADYSGMQSLPANISVIVTLDWLIKTLARWSLLLLLGIFVAFSILYILTERRKNNIRNYLDKNPGEFIIGLYVNAKKILTVFNLRHRGPITPFAYAGLVQKKYSIENDAFIRFTAKYEEAKYSHHVLSKEEGAGALKDYNDFLKILCSRYNKPSLVTKYLLAVFHKTPLFI